MQIFGVSLDTRPRTTVTKAITKALETPRFHRIATLNPEFLLYASKHTVFRDNLNQADIATLDGIGIRLAFWLRSEVWPGRLTGGEITHLLCHHAEQSGLTVSIVVREDGLSSLEEILSALRTKYPRIICSGVALPKTTRSIEELPVEHSALLRNSQVVLCNLGAPGQEYFIESLRRRAGDIRVGVGIGGVFDILTGKIKKAPRWISNVGFEWLWRLLQQPKRFRRIFRAVVVFPWRLLRNGVGNSSIPN